LPLQSIFVQPEKWARNEIVEVINVTNAKRQKQRPKINFRQFYKSEPNAQSASPVKNGYQRTPLWLREVVGKNKT
jgi:hypothetical protein